jgi:hypothetical protein
MQRNIRYFSYDLYCISAWRQGLGQVFWVHTSRDVAWYDVTFNVGMTYVSDGRCRIGYDVFWSGYLRVGLGTALLIVCMSIAWQMASIIDELVSETNIKNK